MMVKNKRSKSIEKNTESNNFCVVINAEEQYSYWFADSQMPAGWKSTGFVGSRKDCLDEVEHLWVDMRPLSVRKAMAIEIT